MGKLLLVSLAILSLCVCDSYGENTVLCETNQCQHDGSCFVIDGKDTCSCTSGFAGPNCEMALVPCSNNMCQNGGICFKNMGGTGYCQCPMGFAGSRCETGPQWCSDDLPCKNGGSCNHMYGTCQCNPGYTGQLCGTEIHECNADSCVHGTCQDDGSCQCQAGKTGKKCDIDQKKADIIFVIETSGSAEDVNHQQESFILDVLSEFTIGCSDVQVGFLHDKSGEIIELGQYDNTEDLVEAIQNIRNMQGETATNHVNALQYGFTEASGDREGVQNIVITLTDGPPHTVSAVAEQLLNSFVKLCAIGIGDEIESAELELIASESNHVIMVDGYDDLPGVKPTLHSLLCSTPGQCFMNPCQNGGSYNNFNDGTNICLCPSGFTGELCQIDMCAANVPDCDQLVRVCANPVKSDTCLYACAYCALLTEMPNPYCKDLRPGCHPFICQANPEMAHEFCKRTCRKCAMVNIANGRQCI